MKNSTDGDSHEGRKRERTVESRRKTRSVTKPPRSERENSSVENGDSMEVSADSTVLQAHAPESEIETPGKLSPAQVRAVQNDFRTGFTVKQIELVTGIRIFPRRPPLFPNMGLLVLVHFSFVHPLVGWPDCSGLQLYIARFVGKIGFHGVSFFGSICVVI